MCFLGFDNKFFKLQEIVKVMVFSNFMLPCVVWKVFNESAQVVAWLRIANWTAEKSFHGLEDTRVFKINLNKEREEKRYFYLELFKSILVLLLELMGCGWLKL